MSNLRVGYCRINITPFEPVPLAGYGNTSTRVSKNILSELYSTCIAFTDEADNTVLLFHNDLISSGERISGPCRKAISEATGIPVSNILIGATHNHSSPDTLNKDFESIARYLRYLPSQLTFCAEAALADRKPARMYIGKAYTKGLNFVRHYVLEDGTFKGDNFGDLNNSPYAGHTTQADPEMRLVKFVREGGKDVVLVNWQTHPHRTGGGKKYDVSADIVGSMRDALEAELDCKFIYFTGGGGNVNPTSRIKEENITPDFIAQGKALAAHAMEAEFQEVETGPIHLLENIHEEPINRPDLSRLEEAKMVRQRWVETNDYPTCCALANEHGFNSPYAAGHVIRRSTFPEGATKLNPMYVFSIGDVAFVTAPYEMFDTNAKQIRDGSPFKMTIVSSCSNDGCGYIPSAYGYQHGCYEADCSYYKPGTGEKFAQIYIDMLNQLYKEN